jgi:hypothetical protein
MICNSGTLKQRKLSLIHIQQNLKEWRQNNKPINPEKYGGISTYTKHNTQEIIMTFWQNVAHFSPIRLKLLNFYTVANLTAVRVKQSKKMYELTTWLNTDEISFVPFMCL